MFFRTRNGVDQRKCLFHNYDLKYIKLICLLRMKFTHWICKDLTMIYRIFNIQYKYIFRCKDIIIAHSQNSSHLYDVYYLKEDRLCILDKISTFCQKWLACLRFRDCLSLLACWACLCDNGRGNNGALNDCQKFVLLYAENCKH